MLLYSLHDTIFVLKKIKASSKTSNRPFAESGHMVRNKLHWDANNAVGLPKQRNSSSPARRSFFLGVPRRHLRPSLFYSVPCDRILQRAYFTRLDLHFVVTLFIGQYCCLSYCFCCFYLSISRDVLQALSRLLH